MVKNEFELLTEKDEILGKLLEVTPNRIMRKVEGRAWTHICCDDWMIRLGQYQLTNGTKGAAHEVKLRETMY